MIVNWLLAKNPDGGLLQNSGKVRLPEIGIKPPVRSVGIL
jgi:hypothetical protein